MLTTDDTPALVIIGTGLAGYNLAREWRKLDATTPLILISRDSGRRYSKPMLSTAFANAKNDQELCIADAGKMAEQLKANILTFTYVLPIDQDEQSIKLKDQTIPYRDLVLATGSSAINLPIENNAPDKTFCVNDLDQFALFHDAAKNAKHIAIIGGGLIGCEYANDLSFLGAQVTVIEQQPHLLANLVPSEISTELERVLAGVGVKSLLGQSIVKIDADGSGVKLFLDNGESIQADVVLSAVGVKANTQLASAAGLTTNRGIEVDQTLATSHPNIYALGDCASVCGHNLFYIMPLMQSARALAKTLSGTPTKVNYPVMPIGIKTTRLPISVVPPVVADYCWKIDVVDGGICALAYDGERLVGFALAGDNAVKQKLTLSKELTPLL